jgi:hypothetical protein
LSQNTKPSIPQVFQSNSLPASLNSSSSSDINNVALPPNIASIIAIATAATTTTNPTQNTASLKNTEKVSEALTTPVSSSELSLLLSKLPILTNTIKEPQVNLIQESTLEKSKENLKSELITKALAPLNIPSNSIIYSKDVKENEPVKKEDGMVVDINNNKTNIQDTNKTIDSSRLDEKAKLDAILQVTMNQTNQIYNTSKTINNSSFVSLNNKPNKYNGMETVVSVSGIVPVNVTTNNNNWAVRSLNRIPPPTYLCTICKIPGHYKNFCPEAVSQKKKFDIIEYIDRFSIGLFFI